MNRADAFALDMCKELNRLCKDRDNGMKWLCRGPLKRGHECVDVTGYRRNKARVLIEVELRRTAPLSNIVKIWKWIDEGNGLPKKLIVVQAFSKFYRRKLDTRRHNAGFIGSKMAKLTGARYIPLDFGFRPGKGAKRGGGARQKQARELAKKVLARIADFIETW
jgi:hypothetical protein